MKGRVERLTELLSEAELDVLLVTELVNVRYLTGFSGTNGIALIGPRTRAFATDFRYVEQAAEQVHSSFARAEASLDLLEAVTDLLPDGELRLGFDDAHMPVRQHARLRELMPGRAELVPAGGMVERVRAIKDAEEVKRIRTSAQLADAAFERIIRDGLIGRTEREVAVALEHDMRQRGARRPSFDSIVATGPHGALPHAQPRDVPIRTGELVVIDWGAELDGYCSDCTRTVAAGEPSDEAREVYELVLSAQLAGLKDVRAGRGGRDVDSVARAIIERGGHGDEFGHGLGHGVGLEVHEAPRLSQRSEDILAPGNIVTVEPGVYVPGRFGVRIEDLVHVTEGGSEVLNGLSKRLLTTD
ncbi:MAG TPA: Xaa-Pro peptidase family protein [Solirubrobacteraceae bacterium]|nr:Xaa-Pro peptidase family protein [Solirubrobacteraceae bacterium]